MWVLKKHIFGTLVTSALLYRVAASPNLLGKSLKTFINISLTKFFEVKKQMSYALLETGSLPIEINANERVVEYIKFKRVPHIDVLESTATHLLHDASLGSFIDLFATPMYHEMEKI